MDFIILILGIVIGMIIKLSIKNTGRSNKTNIYLKETSTCDPCDNANCGVDCKDCWNEYL